MNLLIREQARAINAPGSSYAPVAQLLRKIPQLEREQLQQKFDIAYLLEKWVGHKLNAMKRVLSKYGAYTNHLIALSEDQAVHSADRAKLQGYCHQWTDTKYVLGCAVFIDILTPSAIFPKTTQSDELDI